MTLTARPRFLIRFAVLAALALCGIVLALSSTGTPPVGAQDGSLPAKPTGVVTTATHDSVALAWDDPSDASITHYQIFRRDRDVHDAGEFVTIEDDTGSAATSYTDDTVEPEKRYVYRVKAVNQHGASTWSDFVRADTPAAPDPADLAPSGLEVNLVENRVTLTWDAPASDAASVTGYEILRRRPNDGEAALTTLVADTGNAETGYTDDTANEPGVRYTYRVRALRDGEQSKVSNYDRIDLPEDYAQNTPGSDEPTPTPEALAPSGLTAEAAKGGGVALSWTAPAEDAGSVTGYEVLRARGSAELATLAADTGSTDTAYTDETATAAGETYVYQVKALRGEEKSQVSNQASITLPDEESARSAGDATGVPTISGTPAVGELLTADISNISDPDGVANADFEYQWIAFDGTTDSDISGATGETYRPLLAHVGQTIKVRVTFDDDNDNAESLTSAPTAAVSASTYGQVIWAAAVTVGTHTTSSAGFTVDSFGYLNHPTNSFGAIDHSMFTHSGVNYTVSGIGYSTLSSSGVVSSNKFSVDVNGSLPDSAGFRVSGKQFPVSEVTTTSTDAQGVVTYGWDDAGLTWTDEQEVEVRLTVNRPATGAPAITGKPEVGETLTADISAIMDEDGVPAADQFAYQWISNDGTDDSDIDGATDSTYAVVQADEGKTIKVRVSFTDDAKFPESLTSAATAAVTVPVAALVSNVGQTATGNANVTASQSQGQGFTTGSDSGGYTLGSVELAVSSFSGTASDITVSIYSESSGHPGTLVHTLTTPASISTPVTTFTAPSGTTLAAGTTYYVVISTTGSGINLSRTDATAEDTGGVSGWSIADSGRVFASNAWRTTTSPIRMRVNGDAATASTGIWSATLTVAIGGSFYGYSGIIDVGDLEPAEFTYNGNPATVQVLAYSGNVFYLQTSPALDSGEYLLILDDTPIQLGAASGSPLRHQVSDHGLTWTADQQVEVRLALNNEPTGEPVITGTPEVSQTLTADISGIMDTDGRPDDDQFSYRWIRSDGATDSDISRATNATYKLGSADLDKTIKVRVTFTDGGGFPERLTSDATGPVTPLTVSSDWSLVPSGLGPGDRFRLMFISSGGRDARPTSIDTYNTWIQNLAAAGHTDIQGYSSAFNVVGSTADVDARDNTGTTYTSSDKGVPIYWLNGNKVADQYQDFYDGGWDEEASMRNQSGSSVSPPIPAIGVWTGSAHDGTEGADSMGDSVGFTTIGKPNSGGSGDGPLRSNTSLGSGQTKKLYGLSDVFEVEAIEVPADWSLIPSGLNPGDRFRLLFISSATRTAEATDIATYNTWVQGLAANGHTDIQDHSSTFRVVGSTAAVDARDNTGTTGTGVPIHWLVGDKAADDYGDFYDETWDEEASIRDESGTTVTPRSVFTGSNHDGTKTGQPLGTNVVTVGVPNSTIANDGPLSSDTSDASTLNSHLYALSGVFRVVAGSNTPATGKPTISGTPQVDQTLTADISSIMDADGLPAAGQFSYQWISDDSDIDGATDSTYTLVEADAGKTITVRVSFTDNANYPESLTSAPTVTVLEMVVPEVPFNWSLKPSGLVVGDQFRLIFVSSTGRDASSESIDAYNTWIQSLAAAGHTDIQRYYSTFTVVGSTAAVDARDNTQTTYTSSDEGVPIYWLNGNKVADDYEDFYDGSWGDEANRKTEAGTASSDTTIRTGSDPDGTEKGFGLFSLALGKSLATVGIPDSSATGDGPLSSDTNAADSSTLPLYGLSGVFTVVAPPPTEVPSTWSLVPSGLGEGDEFRLLFVSSTTRTPQATGIGTYNTYVQNRAAVGHTDIRDFSSTFAAVGCTAAMDARDNTYTIYTSSDKGVPIYWLNGNNVADDYEDFYDGGWDDEANPKTEAGTSTSATTIWTGCDEDGTEAIHIGGTASRALGTFSVAFGDLDHATLGPVGHPNNIGGNALSKPVYGLSAVFRVGQGPPTVVPSDWSLIPSGLGAGDEFRLLFLSSTKRSIRSTNISDYNTFVQNRAAAGHTDIQDYSDTFRVLGSTDAKDARDNTGTTYTSSDKGVRIYWLNGDKAADEYQDFYDGSWDQQADAWNESGVEYDLSARRFVATGSSRDGTAEQSNPLGASSGEVQLGCLYQTSSVNGPVFCRFTTENITADDNQQLYGLSGVFQVTSNNPASGAPTISGTLEVRQTLTADISGIMDEDGLPFLVQFSYQWIRSDGTTDSDISGATDSTYTLEDADQGKTIKVRVTFTDEGGTEETLTSDATTAVAADTTGPVVEEVTCFDSLCNLVFDELLDENLNNVPLTIAFAITADGVAITVGIAFPLIDGRFQVSSLAPQIRQGQTVKVVYTDPTGGDDTKAIQDAAGNDASDFTTGEDDVPAVTNDSTLAPVAPGAPTGLTATASGATQIDLAWTAPAYNGGRVVDGYQIEYSDDGGTSWSVLVADTQSTDTLYSDITLTGGETRHYRVSAINSIGTGAASNSPPTGKPVITGTPEVKQTLTADISGIVDANGLPADDQFSYQWIRGDGTDDSDISGATDSTYKLEAADLGKTIKVKVTFTDEGGTEETLTSDATTAVAADTTGPVVEEVICFGSFCNLLFDEPLDDNPDHVPPTNAFAVTADGAAITVASVLHTFSDQLRLSWLAPQIYQGQTVIVTYSDPTSGNDENAIQDEAGNDAADFTTGEDDVPAVTNNSTVEPSTVALVSNADRTIEGAVSRTIQAQSFVTGPSTGGYMLSTIQVRLGDDSALPGVTDLIAAIKVDDGSGEPGALVANLANPASLTNDALNTFTAPTGTVLAPDTTYWVVVNEERSDTDWVNLRVTAQDEEDEAFPGWSIGNNHLSKVSASGSWNHSATVSNLIVVSGSVIVGTADTTGPMVQQVICFGSFCTLFFDEELDVDHSPPTNAFAITADGAAITVGSVLHLLSGQLRLSSLAPQIYQGQIVIVTYTDPTAGNDENAIQDAAGNDAASFTTGEDGVPAVTNNSTEAPVAPGAPTGLTATASGGTQIDLAWTAPADNGGRVITGYQIEKSDDAGTSWSVLVADTQSTDTMYSDTTLSGGDTRHYRVSAINSIDTGAASTVANATTLSGPGVASVTVDQATITQTLADVTVTVANLQNASHTVYLRYRVEGGSWPAAANQSTPTTGAAVTFTLSGLTGNTEYDVAASLDSGFASGVKTASFTTSPTKPGKTRGVSIGIGNGLLPITWTPPLSDGGSAITGYKVQWKSGSQSFGDPSREHTTTGALVTAYIVTGLTNGTEYTLRVIAVNAVGDGPPSDEWTRTPVGPPDAPPNVQAGSGHQQLTVSWGAPNDGGSAITEYTLQWKSGGQSFSSSRQRTIAAPSRTDTIPSLANGTEYTVRVRATTALGDSGWSAEAKGTPREGPHVSTIRVKEPISCTVTFVALEFVNLEAATEYQAHLRFRAQGSSIWTVLSPRGFWSSGIPSLAAGGALNGPSPAFTLPDLAYETTYEVQAALDSGFVDGLATTTFTTPNLSEVGLTPLSPGDGTLGLRMTRPTSEGRVDGYLLQWKSGDEEYDDTDTSERQADVPGPGDREYTITGLDNGVEYTVRAMAYNDNGVGVPSSEVRGTPEAPPNSPARGAPTISGTAQVGETLTADTDGIEDDDGLADAVYSYQWLADDADISGATGETYTPAYDDERKVIRVKVSFADDRDFEETLTSEPTAAVEADPDAPTEPPNAPRTVRIVGDTNTSLTLTWDAPDGGTAVTEYRVQWLTVGEGFANARRDGREAVVDASARSHTITGLSTGEFYQVRVLAVNGAGESKGSNTAWGFPGLGEDQYRHG